MKSILNIFIPLFLFFGTFSLSAQDKREEGKTIFDSFKEKGIGKGTIVINQPDSIKNLVGSKKKGLYVEEINGEAFLSFPGFRIQVFSGNNQRLSKEEAFRKEKEVKEIFPDLSTYVTFTAPIWKLRVGNYRAYDEAHQMLHNLRSTFPEYGKEMYIVQEKISIPIY